MIQNTWIVTNTEDNTLFLLGQTKTEIIASEGPRSMVWDPEKHLLYTTNSLANTVSIIDLTTGSKIDSPQIFDDPRGLALTSEGFSLYVVSKNTDEIIEVSTQNFEVLNRYKTGKSPRNIAIDPATDTFFVTNNGDDTVSILRSDDSHTIPVAKQPYGIYFHPQNGLVYTTNIGENAVCVLSPQKGVVIQQFPVGRHPTHLLANVQKNVLYVACMDDNAVWVCDLSNGEVKKVIPVKSGPFCLSLSSDGRILAVLCNGANSLQWIDTDLYEVVQTAKTGKEPHEVLFLHLF